MALPYPLRICRVVLLLYLLPSGIHTINRTSHLVLWPSLLWCGSSLMRFDFYRFDIPERLSTDLPAHRSAVGPD
ncbi:hypothetical protein EDD18DRAFT_595237 [Armillaria luteobubalina]|uniref:Uncharacterized protein n=1 Tax=Armillaria luteobubalina TaxID=153913 RepID=A0AA39PSF2_9AGAR|nr:hypothetical protein EDD18DRAFT_595237 [Armillaria luteobubalina]